MKAFILGLVFGGLLATTAGLFAESPFESFTQRYQRQQQVDRQRQILNELRRNNQLDQQRNNLMLQPC